MTNATCTLDGCDKPKRARGWCVAHWNRWRRHGDPGTAAIGPVFGEMNPSWRGDDVGYAAVHRRLQVQRGSASALDCVQCGAAAQGWAYQHTAPDERVCDVRNLPFSTDLSHYEAMCLPCHNQLDATHGWNSPAPRGGVSRVAKTGRWRAYATLNGRQHWGGMHDTREEAEAARDALRARLLTDWQAAS